MAKIKADIPPVAELEKFIKDYGLKELINKFSCYDYLSGDKASIKFLKKKYIEYKKMKEDEKNI